MDLVDLLMPPENYLWVQRIKGIQTTNGLRAREINRQRKSHTPRTEDIRNTREFLEVFCCQEVEIRIDVVDVASVDANGCEQPGILASPCEVLTHMTILEEDGWTSVPAFDRATEIVPFVNPADWCGRFTPLILNWLFACYFLQQV